MNSASSNQRQDLLAFADAVNAGQRSHPQNELEHTYIDVQRILRDDLRAMSLDQKYETWEEIMNTLAHPIPTSARKHSYPKRLGWSSFASIAAAVLVVLAGIGVWRGVTYDNVPPTSGINYAAGLAPTTLNLVQVNATPESEDDVMAESSTTSVPIFQSVDEPPTEGPVIWLTTTGTLNYDDGAGNLTVIAEDVTQVNSTTTNVISYFVDDPEKDRENRDGSVSKGYTQTYYNLSTGQTLVDDGTFSSYLGGPNTFGSLTVLTIADAPREWSVVNFETMQSKSISELTGGLFPSSDSITVAVSDDGNTIAIGTSQYQSEASAVLNRQSGLPGEVAIIPADLGSVSWVTVPEGMPAVGNIELSPDGSKIALISQASERLETSIQVTTIVSVVDVASGAELTRTGEVQSNGSAHVQWAGDGETLLLITDKSVQSYAMDGSEPATLFESEGTIWMMPRIDGHPEIMHLLVSDEELVTSSPKPSTTQFVILNAETGDTIAIDGKPWFMGNSYPVALSIPMAPVPVTQSDDSSDAVLVHPITGAIIPDLTGDTYDPLMDPEFEPEEGSALPMAQPVVTASSAPVSAVLLTDGSLAIVTMTETDQDVQVVALAEDAAGKQRMFSPDGGFLTAGASWEAWNGGTYYVLDLSNENSEWIAGPADTMILFVTVENE